MPYHGCELFVPGSISGTVYYDANRNGKMDGGENPEQPQAGVTVYLYKDSNDNKIFDGEDVLADTFITQEPGTFGYPEGTGNYLFKPEIGYEYFVGVESGTDIVTTENYRYYTLYSLGTEHFDQYFGVTAAPVVSLSAIPVQLTEAPQTSTITATLDYEPILPVTIGLNYQGTASADDYTLIVGENATDINTLKFEPGETTASVQLVSVNDEEAEADESVVVEVNSVTNCVTGDAITQTIRILDDDEAGLIVSKSQVEVFENGPHDSFSVQLKSRPTHSVTLSIHSSIPNEAEVSPRELSFPPEEWNTPQTVFVSGKDDLVDDGDQAFVIELYNVRSEDPFYDENFHEEILGVNRDNDEAGLLLSKDNLQVQEELTTSDVFSVKLKSQPLTDVKIKVTSSNEEEGTVDVFWLLFQPSDWQVAKDVVVTSVDERIADGDQTFHIQLDPFASLDEKYKVLGPIEIPVVNVDNDNGVSPIADTDVAVNEVTENADVNDLVGITACAQDEDEEDVVSYHLKNDFYGWFRIDAGTGVVTVAGNIDYEDKNLLNHEATIVVEATSTDLSISEKSFSIRILDAEGGNSGGGDTDHPISAIEDRDSNTEEVNENAKVGDPVGITAFASDLDEDAVSYHLSDDFHGWFQIDAGSGVVTVLGNIDYEDNNLINHEATIVVEATSTDLSTSEKSFAIKVLDADGGSSGNGDTDHSISAIEDTDLNADQVDENATIGVLVGITAFASDLDKDVVSYHLSDDFHGWFQIDGGSGVVSVAGNIDYEDGNLVNHIATIVVVATSTDLSTSEKSFAIEVLNADGGNSGGGDTDHSISAIEDTDLNADQVDENATVGALVGITAFASDLDKDVVFYHLSDDFHGWFQIDAASGIVSVLGNIDYEAEDLVNHEATIVVVATSTDLSSSERSFTIQVLNANGGNSGGGDTDHPISAIEDKDGNTDQVNENAEVGDLVGITAFASDPDEDVVSYHLSNDFYGWFQIDASSGIVTVSGNIDYEDGNLDNHEATIVVVAISTDLSTSEKSFTIKVLDAEGGNSGGGDTDHPISGIEDKDSNPDQVSENAVVGDLVGITAFASDPDEDVVSYQLTNDFYGWFQIDATSGTVSVLGNIDYEDGNLVNHEATIKVVATSTDLSTSEKSFTIKVLDAAGGNTGGGDTDHPITAIEDKDGNTDQVNENAVVGDLVGITAFASDPDEDVVSYQLADDFHGWFRIDAGTGVVSVLGNIDYEDARLVNHLATIVVAATSTDLSTSEKSFTIKVLDADGNTPGGGDTDFSVSQISDVDSAPNEINENCKQNEIVHIQANATDPDGDAVSYFLLDDAGGRFKIDTGTGVVQVKDDSNIDHENSSSHNIVVKAVSTDGSFSTRLFAITVLDAVIDDDHTVSEIQDIDKVENRISENSKVGDLVHIWAFATDPDPGDVVSYSLNNDILGWFTIDEQTGLVKVNGNVDYEDVRLVDYKATFEVIATSGPDSKSSKEFTVKIGNADGTTPGQGDTDHSISAIEDKDAKSEQVSENAVAGDPVGITAFASDPDEDVVSYQLSNDFHGWFQIHPTTGIVSVLGNVDYEDERLTNYQATIVVVATSTDLSTSEKSFTIDVLNAEGGNSGNGDTDHPITAIEDRDSNAEQVNENAIVGAPVGITAFASDPDEDVVSYHLSDDFHAWFQIDSGSGVVTVLGNIDYEDSNLVNHEATIVVVATSTDKSTSERSFTIKVLNADGGTSGGGDTDHRISAIEDRDSNTDQVNENAKVGDLVGITAFASDADEDVVSYHLSNDFHGWFQIDASSGIVSVLGNIDYEAENLENYEATIVVVATSTDLSTSERSFTIKVSNADGGTSGGGDTDHRISAIEDTDKNPDQVEENAVVGDPVGIRAFASDLDKDVVSYHLSNDFHGWFQIDAVSGIVSVLGNIDYEAENLVNHEATIVVVATSTDLSTSERSFTIKVLNADGGNSGNGDTDHPISAIEDRDSNAEQVNENAVAGDPVGITAFASDADDDDVSYRLADDFHGWFQVDPTSGIVSVKGNIDYEDGNLVNHEAAIVVVATSTDLSTSERSFTLKVLDADGGTSGGGDTDHQISAIEDKDSDTEQVNENAVVGDPVGITAFASDPDGDEVSYHLANDFHGWFQIDPSNGIVSVLGNIDYEDSNLVNHEAAIVVVATSTDMSTSERSFTIKVLNAEGGNSGNGDTDHRISAIEDRDSNAEQVNENAVVGDPVGITAFASDPDNDVVSYQLSDDFHGWFRIDPSNGIVSVLGNVDYEDTRLVNHEAAIVVVATSTDLSTSERSFPIKILNADGGISGGGDTDHRISAIEDRDSNAEQVNENAKAGDTVGITAFASDADDDDVSYRLADDFHGWFQIHPSNGIVTVLGNIDYEDTRMSNHLAPIKVVAESTDGSFSEMVFSIEIRDANGSLPGQGDTDYLISDIVDEDELENSISENILKGGKVNITALATDADGDKIIYSLINDADGRFQVDPEKGVVTVLDDTRIDYEVSPSHQIRIRAQSMDGSQSEANFTIKVLNVDREHGDTDHWISQISDADNGPNQVSENVLKDEKVGITALAIDEDRDYVSYSLINDADGRFQISSTTGVITVLDATRIDFENAESHLIRVRAVSTDLSEAYENFTIAVIDVDKNQGDTDHAIVDLKDVDIDPDQVSENVLPGASVGIIAQATDEDMDVITYSLVDDADGRFAIDSENGLITVADASQIDFERWASHTIVVKAKSSDNSELSKAFVIDVLNVEQGDTDHDISDLKDLNDIPNLISENASEGDMVYITANAYDEDGDLISYSLIDDAEGRFQIDAVSGEVTVLNASLIDYEQWISHSIKVKALSSDGSSEEALFTVQVSNEDENSGDTDHQISAISDSNGSDDTISENAEKNDPVGITAFASDADGDLISYSLIDDAEGRFQIDAVSGEITVMDASLIDYEQWISHDIRVKALSTDGSFEEASFTVQVRNEDETSGDTDSSVTDLKDIDEEENVFFEHPEPGISVGITANATDADGDVITYSLTDDANGRFVIESETGVVTLADASQIDYEQWISHSVTIRATSSDASFVENVFEILVKPVNDPPSFVMEGDVEVKEDAGNQLIEGWAREITPGPASEQDQEVEFIVKNNNSELFTRQPEIDVLGNLSFALAENAHGSAQVEVTLRDNGEIYYGGKNVCAPQTFEVRILDVNDSPQFIKGTDQVLEEDAGSQFVEGWASQISAGPYNEIHQKLHFEVSNSNTDLFTEQPQVDAKGNLSYTPGDNSNGISVVTVVLKDDGGVLNGGVDRSMEQSFTITVNSINDIPVALADQYELAEGETLYVNDGGVLKNDIDVEKGNLKAILKKGVKHGSLELLENGSFTYIHDGGESVADDFTYSVSDGFSESHEVEVALVITPVNDSPVLQEDFAVVAEDETFYGANLLENDTDVESNRLFIQTKAIRDVAHGELVINPDGTFVYTPDKDFFGEDSFVYKAEDDGTPAESATSVVHIVVNPVNDAPQVEDNSITVKEASQNNSLNIVAPFDPEEDELEVTVLKLPEFGEVVYSNGNSVALNDALSVEELQQLVYNTPFNYVGQNTFVYQVADSGGLVARAQVSIQVVPLRVFVPEVFTPNGDSQNEKFVIVGIEKYPNNSVQIFNRWGNMVYSKQHYDNSWDGHSNISGLHSGNKLPSSTYFYVVKLSDGKKPLTGSIFLMY
jgi:gliding motility-associated-like protein